MNVEIQFVKKADQESLVNLKVKYLCSDPVQISASIFFVHTSAFQKFLDFHEVDLSFQFLIYQVPGYSKTENSCSCLKLHLFLTFQDRSLLLSSLCSEAQHCAVTAYNLVI